MTRRLLLVAGVAMLLLAELAQAAPDPKRGKTALASAVAGKVEVKEKGESRFGKLGRSPKLIRMGSIVDATRGRVRVRTAGKGRAINEGVFAKGEFEIRAAKRQAITELVLQGDAACADTADAPGLSGESDDPFRTVGRYAAAEAEKPGTRWRTEDRCDGTRTAVKSGRIQASAGPALVLDVNQGGTVLHLCDLDGVDVVSRAYCTMVFSAPELGLWGGGLANLGDATAYDLCVTNPAHEEACTEYPFSEPFGRLAIRDSVVGCYADGGPGAYSLRWLIDGVQLGPALGFESNALAGQDCIHRP